MVGPFERTRCRALELTVDHTTLYEQSPSCISEHHPHRNMAAVAVVGGTGLVVSYLSYEAL